MAWGAAEESDLGRRRVVVVNATRRRRRCHRLLVQDCAAASGKAGALATRAPTQLRRTCAPRGARGGREPVGRARRAIAQRAARATFPRA